MNKSTFRILLTMSLIVAFCGSQGLVPARSQGPQTNAPFLTPIQRVSIASDGTQSNGDSSYPALSADGRYVAFDSAATNLVENDTNTYEDVFVYDRQTGQITIVSGTGQADGPSTIPALSGDGRYVAFMSRASNLVSGDDPNWGMDIFVQDRQTTAISRVSVASDGTKGNYGSYAPAISADGRYVAFYSDASNLVAEDTNGTTDVFVHDRNTGLTSRVSVSSAGEEGNDQSEHPRISADGRFVSFVSRASNLVTGDTNSVADVFVHDRDTGATTRVSVASDGTQGNSSSYYSALSSDGRYVAFDSAASNLVTGDTEGMPDVFVHDRQTGSTTRVSVSSAGVGGSQPSGYPSLTADGRYVVFESTASNLVPRDTNSTYDVFVHDRQTSTTIRASLAVDGTQAAGLSHVPVVSADGDSVVFRSTANNLVSGDTNLVYDVFVAPAKGPLYLRRDTVGIFRPSNATFYLRNSNTTGPADITVLFGSSSDQPVAGDWNGDGIDTIGLYRNGTFYLKDANTTAAPVVYQFTLGNPGDLPMAGDWIGAGKDGAGVFRPTNGRLYLKAELTTGFATYAMVLGINGDRPVAGDWDGDFRSSPGVYRPSNSRFYLTNQVCNCIVMADYQILLGNVGDVGFAGDWNGDGLDGVGVFRPTNGITYLKNALTTGFADISMIYGIANDRPIAGTWALPTSKPDLAPVFVPGR